jgi:hypothetical protein
MDAVARQAAEQPAGEAVFVSHRSQTELISRQGHHVGDMSPTTRTATLPSTTPRARDKQAVARKPIGGAHADPALPRLGGEQGAGGMLDSSPVGEAAGTALGVGGWATVDATRHRLSPSVGRRADRLRGVVEVRVQLVVDRALVGLVRVSFGCWRA